MKQQWIVLCSVDKDLEMRAAAMLNDIANMYLDLDLSPTNTLRLDFYVPVMDAYKSLYRVPFREARDIEKLDRLLDGTGWDEYLDSFERRTEYTDIVILHNCNGDIAEHFARERDAVIVEVLAPKKRRQFPDDVADVRTFRFKDATVAEDLKKLLLGIVQPEAT